MLNKEQFLKRTAMRWRAKKAKTRGWTKEQEELATFVYDEWVKEFVPAIMQEFRHIWYGVVEEENNA